MNWMSTLFYFLVHFLSLFCLLAIYSIQTPKPKIKLYRWVNKNHKLNIKKIKIENKLKWNKPHITAAMAYCKWSVIEQMPFGGHCKDIKFTMIVAATTFICFWCATKLTIFIGRMSASTPFCVRRNQPIGQCSFFPAHTHIQYKRYVSV